MILNDTALAALKISIAIDKTKGTAERYLKSLQEKGYIERSGLDKNRNDYFDDTIRALTEFEERFFNSIIIINNLLFLSASLLSKIIHFLIFRYILNNLFKWIFKIHLKPFLLFCISVLQLLCSKF